MPDLIPTASEAEWLEARRKGVTASEIAIIMGIAPDSYGSAYRLYHEKLGILPPQDDIAVFERGRVLEPYIADKFAAAHPEFLIMGTGRELYAHDDRPWQLATPDRLLQDAATCGVTERDGVFEVENVAVLETKTDAGSDEWGEPGTDEIPVHYRCQVLWQMDVMGVSTAYVSCLDPARWQIREYVIEHGNCFATEASERIGGDGPCSVCRDQALMLDAARDFLGRIDRQDPPDVDWRPATIGALKQLHPSVEDEDVVIGVQLRERYRAAVRNHKKWEQRKKLYEARIREVMGSAHHAVSESGVPVARRDVYEVKAHERKASTVDKLVPVYPKKAK